MKQSINSIFLHKIYSRLVECAMNNETITSAQLAADIGLPTSSPSSIPSIMNSYLSSITDFEHNHGRPMLTAMVVQKSLKPTKAWLKVYLRLRENLNETDVELRAKDLLRASASEDCKLLLELEQKRVAEYWTIPDLPNNP